MIYLALITILIAIVKGSNPAFWNKFDLTIDNFYLYYGWSADNTRIFFRLVGVNNGWIALALGSTMTNTDMLIMRHPPNTGLVVEDRWSVGHQQPSLDLNPTNYVIEQGGFTQLTGKWDITVSRLANTGDNYDTQITNEQRIIAFGKGSSHELIQHSGTPNRYSITFQQSQICHTDCQDGQCTGPDSNNCIQCRSSNKIVYKGNCIPNQPDFWNLGTIFQANGFRFLYGLDSTKKYMYFNYKGVHNGWVAFGLGIGMTGADIMFANMANGQIEVKDLKATEKAAPPDDEVQDVKYVSGTRDNAHNWNVVIVRALNTGDLAQDTTIFTGVATSVVMAFGPSDNRADKHANSMKGIAIVTFLSDGQCPTSCDTCQGPEENQCLTCKETYYLAGISPNQCLLCFTGCKTCNGPDLYDCLTCVEPRKLYFGQCFICHSSCNTCSGTSANQCLSCAQSDKLLYKGTCIENYPRFWNVITLTNVFNLYYGFDSNFNYIFLRLYGTSQWAGWVGIGISNIDQLGITDTIRVFKDGATIVVRDGNYRGNDQSADDVSNDLVYVSGGRDSLNFWDVTIVRKLNTLDVNEDNIIELNQQYNILFELGPTDSLNDLPQQGVTVTSRSFQTTAITLCYVNCKTCLTAAEDRCTTCLEDFIYENGRCVSCHVTCLTCSGSQENDCITCHSSSVLQQDGTCQNTGVEYQCHFSCLTCHGPAINECSSCSTDIRKFIADGYCLLLNPTFWNLIHQTSRISLYYGQDVQNEDYQYFRFKGTNRGWVGLGFGHSMVAGMDSIQIEYTSQRILVYDRYATGHFQPQLDSRQNVYLLYGSRDDNGYWDVVFAKKKIAVDTQDKTLQPNQLYNISLVLGGNDFISQKHLQKILIFDVEFAESQVCHANCKIGCTGPESNDCKQSDLTNSRGGLVITQMVKSSIMVFQVLIAIYIMITLYI